MRCIRVALLMLASAAIPVAAQLPADTTPPSLTRAIGGLRQGDVVRVALERATWVGRFERIGGDTLFFGTTGQQPMAIRFSAIDTLWRQSSSAGRASRIGGVTLGLLFGLGGFYIGQARDGDSGAVQGAVVGGFLGAGLGSVIGGLAGPGARPWNRLYP